MELISEHGCFGGVQAYYRHTSSELGLPMRFSVYRPPQQSAGPVPVLVYLAGLTCTEETFMIKAGAQRYAAQHGIMLVAPDTSPRNTGIDGIRQIGTLAKARVSIWMPARHPMPRISAWSRISSASCYR